MNMPGMVISQGQGRQRST